MAKHNCEGLDPTDDPSTVPTTIQGTNDQTFNPWCAHNPMATQCNQSQYTNLNHNFVLPQFMSQPNSEESTARQATCDHTFNPKCTDNLMETHCNQPSTSSH